MIQSIYISNSYGKEIDKTIKFNDDIITGLNGAGKTTLMKLLWYIISGNIKRISDEIEIRNFKLDHSSFSIEIDYLFEKKSLHTLTKKLQKNY